MNPNSQSTMHHNLPNGPIDYCQICASRELEQIINLGHQPPCDSLLTPEQLKQSENIYPLNLVRCGGCGLVQIDYVVPPEILFHPDYPYRSGITATLASNLQGTGEHLAAKYNLGPGSLAVDIGSNDGTLLKGFRNKGLNVLGVEATNISRIANQDGIETLQAFFSETIAEKIVGKYGQASVVTAANMFAHVPNLGQLLRGVTRLLVDGGTFVTESHYLLDLLETAQYDSIYQEHLKYYALKPLQRLFDDFGFTVVDVDRIPNYGGSIRVYATKGKGLPVSDGLTDLLREEERAGVYDAARYDAFRETVLQSKLDLQALLLKLRREGRPAPGIGCPGRSSTLLNYCNIDPDLMPYIAEQSSSLKLGLYLPGKHIPIVDEQRLFDEQPDYAVMLSWHYAEPIIAKLRERGLRSKIIMPLPRVHVIED
ncbi:MAG: class I SAM-dependent methyltransferase [Proteobacteria bacterium]|nr:class I SAM-dependent methyltransferase [Pseudomonadota bacterium]